MWRIYPTKQNELEQQTMTRTEITNRNQNPEAEYEASDMVDSPVANDEMTDETREAVAQTSAPRDEEPEMFRRQTPSEDQTPQNFNNENGAAATPEDSSAAATNDADSTASGTQAVDENDDRLLRAVADLENFKRQSARRETESRDRALRGVIEDLLPVMDNFERALDAARNARDVDSVRVGVEFIAQQLRDALKNHGVEPIEAQGQKFDPLHHEALEEVESDQPEGTVVEEAQRGYSFKGQVLRPSLVRVAGK